MPTAYSSASNASRAAKALAARHPDILEVDHPVEASDGSGYHAALKSYGPPPEGIEGVAVVERLPPRDATAEAPKPAKRRVRVAKPKKAKPQRTDKRPPKDGSRRAQFIAMLSRPEGATVAEVMAEMGGLEPHTVRGMLSFARNAWGYDVNRSAEGRYRITGKRAD